MNLSHKVDYNSNTFIVQDDIIYWAMQDFHNDGIALYFWLLTLNGLEIIFFYTFYQKLFYFKVSIH